ncbi:hypothetical protein BDW66DRAFT_141846 [Aspergillus desertorum]
MHSTHIHRSHSVLLTHQKVILDFSIIFFTSDEYQHTADLTLFVQMVNVHLNQRRLICKFQIRQ